jgi:hypothetical protein
MARSKFPETGTIVAERVDCWDEHDIAAAICLPAEVWHRVTADFAELNGHLNNLDPEASLAQRIAVFLDIQTQIWAMESALRRGFPVGDEPDDGVPF